MLMYDSSMLIKSPFYSLLSIGMAKGETALSIHDGPNVIITFAVCSTNLLSL